MSGADALKRAGLEPIRLSFKEGLALNNGTAQMLATAALALDTLEQLLDTADLAASMTLDAFFAGRSGALREEVHALRPHPGQVQTAAHVREPVDRFHLDRHPLSPGAALQIRGAPRRGAKRTIRR